MLERESRAQHIIIQAPFIHLYSTLSMGSYYNNTREVFAPQASVCNIVGGALNFFSTDYNYYRAGVVRSAAGLRSDGIAGGAGPWPQRENNNISRFIFNIILSK